MYSARPASIPATVDRLAYVDMPIADANRLTPLVSQSVLGRLTAQLSSLHCRPLRMSEIQVTPDPRHGLLNGTMIYWGWTPNDQDRATRWHLAVARTAAAFHGEEAEEFFWHLSQLDLESRFNEELKVYDAGRSTLIEMGYLKTYSRTHVRWHLPEVTEF